MLIDQYYDLLARCPVIRRAPRTTTAFVMWVSLTTGTAFGQVTPSNPVPPPVDDTPSVKVGGTFFGDYTYTFDPEVTDADGNRVSPSAFNVMRTYINVTGQLNHLFAFRITPDISRETGTGSSLAGSMTFRLKYGYVQFNMDDWLWRGTYVRAGMIQTPYVEFEESIYRYRFQGPVFVDREGFRASADVGVSFRTQFPGGYGEAVVGLYNGEGYTRADPNDQKSVEIRGTLRPLPGPGLLRGLRVSAYYDADHYVKNAERNRFVSLLSYEHRFINAGWVYLDATDQTLTSAAKVDAKGHSVWFTPKLPVGPIPKAPPAGGVRASLEGLIRYDYLEPNNSNDSEKTRTLIGIAYWPKMTTGTVTSAFLLDWEQVRHRGFTPSRPNEKRIALHMLLTF